MEKDYRNAKRKFRTLNIGLPKDIKCSASYMTDSNAISLNLSGWIQPKYDDDLDYYLSKLKRLEKELKRYIYFNVNNEIFNKDNFILIFDYPMNNINTGKRTFIDIDVTFRLVNRQQITKQSPLFHDLKVLGTNILNDLLFDNKSFEFYKTKNS